MRHGPLHKLALRAYRHLQQAAPGRDSDKLPLILSIIDQAVLSSFGLLLTIVLIRIWSPDLFGRFVVVLTLSLVCGSAQGALIGTQLSVLRPQLSLQGQLSVLRPQLSLQGTETKLLASLWAANCVLILSSMLMSTIAIALCWQNDQLTIALSAGLYVGGSLLREYVRYLLFSERRSAIVLSTDLLYVGSAVILLSCAFEFAAFSLSEILIGMACANVLACVPAVFRRAKQFTFRIDRETLTIWTRIWRGPARWALFGALTHEFARRSHIFVVQAVFGAAAVGLLQAGEMIFRPLVLLGQAWERVAKPSFAQFAAAGDGNRSRSLEHFGLFAALLVTVFFFLILFLAWPQLDEHLFVRGYDNMERIAVLWGVATLMQLASQVYSTELQGFVRFGELGAIGTVTALTGALLLVSAVHIATFEWTILALIGSNLVGIILMKIVLRRIYRSDHLAASISQSTYNITLNRLFACFR